MDLKAAIAHLEGLYIDYIGVEHPRELGNKSQTEMIVALLDVAFEKLDALDGHTHSVECSDFNVPDND